MTLINAYLTFDGNCREAMEFYHECFGGELILQPLGVAPVIIELSDDDRNKIMHASLIRDGLILMGSDLAEQDGVVRGNTISLALNCSSHEEIMHFYAKLSEGGHVTDPLSEQFWGALFGSLVDKYGITWLLNYEMNRAN